MADLGIGETLAAIAASASSAASAVGTSIGAMSTASQVGLGLSAVGAGTTILGTAQQASAQRTAGLAAQQEDNYEAGLMRQQAGQDQAASQRSMLQEKRQKALLESTAQANAAGSGASASDPTVLDLMGNLEGQGDLNEKTALYEGDSKAQSLTTQAGLKTWEGNQARKGGIRDSQSTILSGASSLFTKYGPQAINALPSSGTSSFYDASDDLLKKAGAGTGAVDIYNTNW